MSDPRIAVMATGLGHVARGVESWADGVATELHRRGVDVTLFKGKGPAQRKFERVVPCIRRGTSAAKWAVKLAPSFCWRFGLSQTYDLEQMTFALALLPHLIRERYDLIHLQDPWLGLMLEKTRRLHGASVILGHGTEEAPWLLRKFEHVQELSPFYLSRHGDIGDRRWFAVPNFIDAHRFAPGDRAAARQTLGLPSDAFIILSVAALNRSKKRLDWLAREVAKSGRQDVCLVLAGAKEPETPDLVAELKQMLGDRVRVFENVPHAKMHEYFHAADVHVMCSLKEVLGISILEAQACGIPNIVHQWGSVEWAVGEAGWVVDMESEGALAARIRDLTPETCRQMGHKARHRAVTVFSVEAVISQMQAMYEEVLSIRRAAREHRVPSHPTPTALPS